jgi:hypothetical protein
VTENVPLRQERALGFVINDSFRILFAYWPSLAKTVAPAVLVSLAAALLAYGVQNNGALYSFVVLATLPVQFVAYQLVSAALIASLNSRDQGREIDAGDALDMAQDRFRDVVSASVRATAIAFALMVTIVGIPWGIKRLVKWAFVIQAIIVDGQTGKDSLAYSESLVLGRWWGTFGRLVACGLIVGLPAVIVSEVILLAIPGVIGIIASQVTDFLALPFGIISTTLIFFDLKSRKARHDSFSPA